MNRGQTLVALATLALVSAVSPARSQDAPPGCSWIAKTDPDTVNAAFPDDQATYWLARFTSVPGTRLVIRGHYPAARYFSFNVYDEPQRPVDAIADQDTAPDAGSANPFATPGAPYGGTYTAFVAFIAKPADPAPNTLYAGAMGNGTPNPAGFLIYRVYVSDDPANRAGSVALPRLSLEVAPGVELPFRECDPPPPSSGGQVNQAIMESNYPDEGPRNAPFPLASARPRFSVFYGLVPGGNGGFYSNVHNAYMRVSFSRQYGDVFVFRAKAPGFPDTRAGEPVVRDDGAGGTIRPDLRYWSICQNELATQRFVKCSADFQTPLDADGWFTFVVSDPADRPGNATAANGVTWLPWGGAYYDGMALYRHMLPNGSFAEAIQNVPQGTDPRAVLGDYFPGAAYCAKETFEGGSDAAAAFAACCAAAGGCP